MFRFPGRARTAETVRFCDGCAEVTTAAQRAERLYESSRARQPLGLPR